MPSLTSLRRKLGDYLDYSKPPSCYKTDLPYNSHSTVLPINRVSDLVHYPYLFSQNGFGFRYLNASEKCSIFGLPWSEAHSGIHEIVPIQILDSLLSHLLELETLSVPTQTMQTFPSIHHDKGYTVLPELKINLYHD